MNKPENKLKLNRETLKTLSKDTSKDVMGGQGNTQFCKPNSHYTCGGTCL